MITKRETYDFVDGKVIIPDDENISAMQKIWAINWKNIKKLHLLMVSNSVNIDELNMENITESTETVKIIDTMTETSLKLFNKIQYTNESKLNSEKFTVIPHHSLCFVPKLLNISSKLVYIAELHNENIKCSIRVRYLITDNSDEFRKFVTLPHEYLVKRHITKTYSITKGENEIEIPYINVPILYLTMCSKKNTADLMNINVNYKIKNKIAGTGFHNMSIKLDEVNNDCENYRCSLESNDVYLLNAGIDINDANIMNQPCSHFVMEPGSKINITSEIDTSIDVSFFMYNVLRYISTSIGFAYPLNPLLGVENPSSGWPLTFNTMYNLQDVNTETEIEDTTVIETAANTGATTPIDPNVIIETPS